MYLFSMTKVRAAPSPSLALAPFHSQLRAVPARFLIRGLQALPLLSFHLVPSVPHFPHPCAHFSLWGVPHSAPVSTGDSVCCGTIFLRESCVSVYFQSPDISVGGETFKNHFSISTHPVMFASVRDSLCEDKRRDEGRHSRLVTKNAKRPRGGRLHWQRQRPPSPV